MRSKAHFMLTLLVLYQVAPTIFSTTEALFTFTRIEQTLLEHAREQVCIQVTKPQKPPLMAQQELIRSVHCVAESLLIHCFVSGEIDDLNQIHIKIQLYLSSFKVTFKFLTLLTIHISRFKCSLLGEWDLEQWPQISPFSGWMIYFLNRKAVMV